MTVNNENIFIGFHISDFGIISVPDIANPKMVRIINNGTARFAAFDKEAVVFIDIDLDEDSEKIFTSYFQKVAFTQFRNTQQDIDGDVKYIAFNRFTCNITIDDTEGVVEAFHTSSSTMDKYKMQMMFTIPFIGKVNGRYFNEVMCQKGRNYNG